MKISILVPVYNAAAKIERCAESLFKQTYENIEYVFVDDCSTDNCIELLLQVMEKFPERKEQIRILHNTRNLKQSGTRNKLLDKATGELVMFVDSDDYLPMDACQVLYNALQSSGADVASGAYLNLLPNGKRKINAPKMSNKKHLTTLVQMNIIRQNLWARLYKRSLFEENKIRCIEGVNLAEDYMMLCQLMLTAKRTEVDNVVYYYDETEIHDYTQLYEQHIEQMERAVMGAEDYFLRKKCKSYSSAFQVAYISVCRNAAKEGLQTKFVKSRMKLWARLVAKLIENKSTFPIGNFIMKIIRSLNIAFAM